MSCLPPPAKSGRYDATFASRSSAPRSICCTARIEVNSLDTDARSKTVSSAIAICWSAGNSTPVSVFSSYAAYRTALPIGRCSATVPPRPASSTAPANHGCLGEAPRNFSASVTNWSSGPCNRPARAAEPRRSVGRPCAAFAPGPDVPASDIPDDPAPDSMADAVSANGIGARASAPPSASIPPLSLRRLIPPPVASSVIRNPFLPGESNFRHPVLC